MTRSCCRASNADILYEKFLDIEAVLHDDMHPFTIEIGKYGRLALQEDSETIGEISFELPSDLAPDLYYVYYHQEDSTRLICAINPKDDSEIIAKLISVGLTQLLENGD